jgi:cytoskeletal protein CcmA (bactofilin family)
MSDTNDKNSSQKRTLVEEGTEFKGSLKSSCPIVVMGKVEGDISGPSILISPSGVVAGTVKVTELRSEGELAGEVDADTVTLSGRVRDNTVIRARTLEVSLARSTGQMEVVFGHCELAVGEAPSKDAAISAALAPAAPTPAPGPGPKAVAPSQSPSPASATGPAAEPDATDDNGAPRPRRSTRTQPPPMA